MGQFELLKAGETRSGVCPHCEQTVELDRVAPAGDAPKVVRDETLLACRSCGRLSVPVSNAKRLGGMVVLVPFGLLLLLGLGAAVYFVVTMLLEGAFSAGFAVISAILVGGCMFGLTKVVRTLRRLIATNALLPLMQDDDGTHRLLGEL